MPDVPEVLDAEAGEDQQRDRQRPLDALGAAERVRLAQRPRRLRLREGQELPDVLGIVELLEPVAVAPAHDARLLRVEAAAERGRCPSASPHRPERSDARHGGASRRSGTPLPCDGSPARTPGGRKCRRPSLKLLPSKKTARPVTSSIGRMSRRTSAEAEATEEDDVARRWSPASAAGPGRRDRAGPALLIRSVQRADVGAEALREPVERQRVRLRMNGEARIVAGQPAMVRPKWFHMAIVCLMTLRGCLVMHSSSSASRRPTRCSERTSSGAMPRAEQ